MSRLARLNKESELNSFQLYDNVQNIVVDQIDQAIKEKLGQDALNNENPEVDKVYSVLDIYLKQLETLLNNLKTEVNNELLN